MRQMAAVDFQLALNHCFLIWRIRTTNPFQFGIRRPELSASFSAA
jgi:hypothetical protein